MHEECPFLAVTMVPFIYQNVQKHTPSYTLPLPAMLCVFELFAEGFKVILFLLCKTFLFRHFIEFVRHQNNLVDRNHLHTSSKSLMCFAVSAVC